MIYAKDINKHNMVAHYDIDADMEKKRNGLFTFVIKVNNGKIVGYMELESDNFTSLLNEQS